LALNSPRKEVGSKEERANSDSSSSSSPSSSSSSQRNSTKRKSRTGFRGYFSIYLSLAILAAALIYIVYGNLPYQYYLPLSFAIVAAVALAGFVILLKKIEI
jgi:hypothetical protein